MPVRESGRDGHTTGENSCQQDSVGRVLSRNQAISAHAWFPCRRISCFQCIYPEPAQIAMKQKLWWCCRLGVIKYNSEGMPSAYKHLDGSGAGILKAISYQCWPSAQHANDPNEAYFVLRSLATSYGQPDICAAKHTVQVLAVL